MTLSTLRTLLAEGSVFERSEMNRRISYRSIDPIWCELNFSSRWQRRRSEGIRCLGRRGGRSVPEQLSQTRTKERYSMRRPEIAQLNTNRWICLVPLT